MLRQPIVCVLGHVDHGKTSLLDSIRKTTFAKKEAGAITQHIGASEVPSEAIVGICGNALERMRVKVDIPGLLFIDTPGHEAFSNLRERGGSIADIAVLVIDINQGIQPQTVESIGILKKFKTPFVIAANKVDVLEGWKRRKGMCIAESISGQNEMVQARLDELLYGIVGRLAEFGLESERFDRVEDFTKQIVIVPISAKTGEGVLELLLFLAGLSQKFLEKELQAGEEKGARGSIIEVRDERGLGKTVDAVIYEGVLKKNDTIIFGTINGAQTTRVRSIIKPKPASLITNPQEKYEYPDEARAACGVKIFAPGLEGALSGSPIAVVRGKEEMQKEKENIEKQVASVLFEHEAEGVLAKADTLGSLEALLNLLEYQKTPVRKTGLGEISRKDLLEARNSASKDARMGAVFGFCVSVAPEAASDAEGAGVKILTSNVIYSLVDEYEKWLCELREKEKCALLATHLYPAKLKVLPGCCFRKSNPAVFGVEVLGGRLVAKCPLMSSAGKEVGQVKGIQRQNEGVQTAQKGEQVAISIDGAYFGRDIKEGDMLYAKINRKEWEENIKKCRNILGKEEEALLQEIFVLTSSSYFE